MNTPWNELHHAYGVASDIPKWLTNLRSPEADIRDDAWSELNACLEDRGTVYSATPHAVPHLLDILQDPQVQDRKKIVWLLRSLILGASDPPEFGDQVREKVTAALLLVQQLMLHDPDPEVRRDLHLILVHLPGCTAFALGVLHEALTQDPDAGVKASCLTATLELLLKENSKNIPEEAKKILNLLPHCHNSTEDAAVRLVSCFLTVRYVDRDFTVIPKMLEDFETACRPYEEEWVEQGPLDRLILQTLEEDPELAQVWFQVMIQNPSVWLREHAFRNMRRRVEGFRDVEGEACELVTAGLKDPEAQVRIWASSLACIMGPLAQPLKEVLWEALLDSEVRVRCYALMCLGQLDPEVRPHIVRFALSDHWEEMEAAVDTMERTGGLYPEIHDHFVRLLRLNDEELKARLSDIPLYHQSTHIRQPLIRGLGFTEEGLPEDVLRTLDPTLHLTALQVLKKTGTLTEARVDLLLEHLLDQPENLLRELQSLEFSTPTTLDALRNLMDHEWVVVQAHAAVLWWKWTGDAETAQPILLLFLSAALEETEWVWASNVLQILMLVMKTLHEMGALPANPVTWLKPPRVAKWFWHKHTLETLWEITHDAVWMKECLLAGLQVWCAHEEALQILGEIPDLSNFQHELRTLKNQKPRMVLWVPIWHEERLRKDLERLLA